MVQPKEPTAHHYNRQLVALGRVLQTLREEDNADVLIDTVLGYLQSEFDYQLIWIGIRSFRASLVWKRRGNASRRR